MDYLFKSRETGLQGLHFYDNLANEISKRGIKVVYRPPIYYGPAESQPRPIDVANVKIMFFKNGHDYIYDDPDPRFMQGDDIIMTLIHADTSNIKTRGFDGDDLIYGNDGSNILMGDNGNDILLGRGGDDVLDGGPGVNELYGGTGNDVYVYNGIGLQNIYDCEGENVIRISDDHSPTDLQFVARPDGSAFFYYKEYIKENEEVLSNGIYIKNHINPACQIYEIESGDNRICMAFSDANEGIGHMVFVQCDAQPPHSEL